MPTSLSDLSFERFGSGVGGPSVSVGKRAFQGSIPRDQHLLLSFCASDLLIFCLLFASDHQRSRFKGVAQTERAQAGTSIVIHELRHCADLPLRRCVAAVLIERRLRLMDAMGPDGLIDSRGRTDRLTD